MECWNTSGDIKLISESLLEGDSSSEDSANALMGLQKIHDLRCQKAWNIFEELIHSGAIKYNFPERTAEVTDWEYIPTEESEENFSKKKKGKKK